MPYATDERLKSYLDTNQLGREQMCRGVLAIDGRFIDVRPRHPRGGPDGGRDMEATFNGSLAFGAVGFLNQANDSEEQKKKVAAKFEEDVESALGATPKPDAFVFFTNVNLTLGEKDALVTHAKQEGFSFCEVFDRERIRIELDSPDGFYLRYQFLNLPLSEAEQASFFARWGDDLQSVIATGFQQVHGILERVLFLQEAEEVLGALRVTLELDRAYSSDEIGHFRAFCSVHLREPKHRIWFILFGSYDQFDREKGDASGGARQPKGIKHGIGGQSWEKHFRVSQDGEDGDANVGEYVPAGSSSSIGSDSVELISISYSHDLGLVRYQPRLTLRDLDEAGFVLYVNESLAVKLRGIHVYANGYKLQDVDVGQFVIDRTKEADPDIPIAFDAEELRDKWTTIRAHNATFFTLSFSDQTPKRMYETPQIRDGLAQRRNKR